MISTRGGYSHPLLPSFTPLPQLPCEVVAQLQASDLEEVRKARRAASIVTPCNHEVLGEIQKP